MFKQESELNDVEKAARKSMLSHFQDLKKAASDHAAAAQMHMQAVHGAVNKVMKLAGFTNDPEHEGGQSGVHVPEVSTEVKAAEGTFQLIGKTAEGVEVFKRVAAPVQVEKSAAEIQEKADRKAAKKASKAAFKIAVLKLAGMPIPAELESIAKAAAATEPNRTVVGDRKDVRPTGAKVEKTTAERKAENDALLEVAKAGFAGDGKALSELYDKTVTRTPIRPGAAA